MRTLVRILPAIMLFFIIVWALVAVLFLTRTYAAAVDIEDDVGVINNQVSPINKELDSVRFSVEIAGSSGQIRQAAVPLTGQFSEIIKSGDGIEASALQISDKVKPINASAKSINTSVRSINSNVDSIGSFISTVESDVLSVGSSVDGINSSFTGILDEVVVIDGRLVRANNQVDTVIGSVRGIKGDTGVIRGLVDEIKANALAIENSIPLLNSLPQGGSGLALHQSLAAGSLQLPLLPGLGLPALPGLLPALPGLGLPTFPALPLPEAPGLPAIGPMQQPGLLGIPLGADTGPLLQGAGSR